jgi:hypothetical protein
MAVSAAESGALRTTTEASVGAGIRLLAFFEVLIIGIWLGSMMFFSFAVAPSAFSVLPSRHLSGQIVSSTLTKVEVLGLIFGFVLLIIQPIGWRARAAEGRGQIVRAVLITVMLAMAALSRFWVSPALNALRGAMGGRIDDVPATDPLRVEFNDLHQYSVWLMATAMLAGITLLFLTVRSWMRR